MLLNFISKIFFVFRFTKDKIKVTLGEYSFDQEGETSVQKKIGVRDLKMHENYDDKSFENDIALIRLDRKVQFTKSVYPICFPPKDKDYTDTRAFVIGKLKYFDMFIIAQLILLKLIDI